LSAHQLTANHIAKAVNQGLQVINREVSCLRLVRAHAISGELAAAIACFKVKTHPRPGKREISIVLNWICPAKYPRF
jgi:hypothetical protein